MYGADRRPSPARPRARPLGGVSQRFSRELRQAWRRPSPRAVDGHRITDLQALHTGAEPLNPPAFSCSERERQRKPAGGRSTRCRSEWQAPAPATLISTCPALRLGHVYLAELRPLLEPRHLVCLHLAPPDSVRTSPGRGYCSGGRLSPQPRPPEDPKAGALVRGMCRVDPEPTTGQSGGGRADSARDGFMVHLRGSRRARPRGR